MSDSDVITEALEKHVLPYRIGLTGNIATGKSTVGRMLVELGAVLIDADRVAHDVLMPGGAAYASVLQTFGSTILSPDGLLDRQKLGAIVFSNPEAMQRLESLVHPPVIASIDQTIADLRVQIVVVEAIKLLETGMADNYDAIWVTTCPEPVQLARLMRIRKLQREDALLRLQAQSPQEDKLVHADVVINTAGTLEETRAQVREAWRHLPLDLHQADGRYAQSVGA
ncbi:MAG: dephospho-CoA kinase [Anaerolineales bacterium]|nr:MAG: dephospho-CoA kinase [Anaerolineales bacterium]